MRKIILFIFFISASSVIFSDSGQYLLDHGADFDCKNNFQTTRTISFSEAFQNIPQMFMYQDYCDIPNTIAEYQFSITSITLNILVKCPKSGLIWGLRYHWIVLDDQRIQVINSFNVNPPQDKEFNHQLLNVDNAIIGLTSLSYSGQIEFQLSISSITKDSVSVGITKVARKFTNLKQIGYQILLVASRDMIDLGLITFKPNYTSNTKNLESNKLLLLPIQGIKYLYGNQLTLKMEKLLELLQYIIHAQDGGNYDQSEFTIQNLWMSQQLINNYAIEYYTLRISQNQRDIKAFGLHFLFKYDQLLFLNINKFHFYIIFQTNNTSNKLNIQYCWTIFHKSLQTYSKYQFCS